MSRKNLYFEINTFFSSFDKAIDIVTVSNKQKLSETDNLLERFNKRDIPAFGEVYSLYYDDLFYYALKLYENTNIEPQDAVHDTFLKLWQQSETKFKSQVI